MNIKEIILYYLDLHLEIDNDGRLRSKLYDKRDDFNFPIVNFPFICSNIPAVPAYRVYISQFIRYSRACGSYQDFMDRGLLLTRKLLRQGFLAIILKSSLRKFYGRHHELVDRYEVSVSQMTQDLFSLSWCFLVYLTSFVTFYWTFTIALSSTTGATSGAGTAYPSGTPEFTPGFWWGSCYSFLVFCVVFLFCLLMFVLVFFLLTAFLSLNFDLWFLDDVLVSFIPLSFPLSIKKMKMQKLTLYHTTFTAMEILIE